MLAGKDWKDFQSCLIRVSLDFFVAAPEPFLCFNNVAVCP
jgi:hypothetical protein